MNIEEKLQALKKEMEKAGETLTALKETNNEIKNLVREIKLEYVKEVDE